MRFRCNTCRRRFSDAESMITCDHAEPPRADPVRTARQAAIEAGCIMPESPEDDAA
jgi:hypothetical protein